jgi:alkylated DNA repair dioxygenase AlkB
VTQVDSTSIDVAPLQTNLFALGEIEVDPSAPFQRTDLGEGAWVDVARGWLKGADDVAGRLARTAGWRHHQRWMYDRLVDEPRLSRWYRSDDALPDPALGHFRREVGRHYEVTFGAVGLNFYRSGSDSVAFHADRELEHLDETLVAIVTFGAARPFLLRPVTGGRSVDLRPASGDLLVMGGSCQRGWEHSVPRTSRACGPRMSASVRWAARAGPEREWSPADRIVKPAG